MKYVTVYRITSRDNKGMFRNCHAKRYDVALFLGQIGKLIPMPSCIDMFFLSKGNTLTWLYVFNDFKTLVSILDECGETIESLDEIYGLQVHQLRIPVKYHRKIDHIQSVYLKGTHVERIKINHSHNCN